MITEPMPQQLEALRAIEAHGDEFFALLMEQGTGKTWCALAQIERLYAAGKLDAALVIAPNGVHTNWIRTEIPTHLGDANVVARRWTPNTSKRAAAEMEEVFATGKVAPLRIFAISIDAVATARGFAFAKRFVRSAAGCAIIVDESQRIKNPKAARSKAVHKLAPLAQYRYILSGTPVTNNPADAFSQFEFLGSGVLGTTSYRAFVAEYTQLVSDDSPMMRRLVQKNPRAAWSQIPERDDAGMPIYRNLDKLQRLIGRHSYRVTKDACLGLPPKVFQRVFFEMTPTQARHYRMMDQEQRAVIEDIEATYTQRIAAMAKLQEITSGYLKTPEGLATFLSTSENPRLAALMEVLEDIPEDESIIVWAQFRPELTMLAMHLRKQYGHAAVVEYHGGVSDAGREEARERFQARDARIFVANPDVAGTGLTLHAASRVVYFSCRYNLETRLQSEDRAHRKGQTRTVIYTDIVGEGTIDEDIAANLQAKTLVARRVLPPPAEYQR